MGDVLDNNGDLVDIRMLDHSAFVHLFNDEGRGIGMALRVYE